MKYYNILLVLILVLFGSCTSDDQITKLDNKKSQEKTTLEIINKVPLDTVLIITFDNSEKAYLTDMNHNVKYIVWDDDSVGSSVFLAFVVGLLIILFLGLLFH